MDPDLARLPLHDLACDRHPPEDEALTHVARDGAVTRWTFGDVHEASRRYAHVLRRHGVGPGDRVAIVLAQRPEAPLTHLACSRLAAVSVPLSPLFGPDGLRPRLGDARPRVVLTTRDDRPKVDEALENLPVNPVVHEVEGGALDDAPPLPLDAQETPAADDPMMLVYTSGTTGQPKGAVLPHRVLPGRLPGLVASHAPFPQPGDRFWSPADWSWIGGLLDSLLAPWALGVPVLGHDRGPGGLDWTRTLDLLEAHGVTCAFLPPTGLKSLRQHATPPPPKLRSVHAAGEPLPEAVQTWAEKAFGQRVADVYGLTEAAFLIGNRGHEPPADPQSLGRPFEGHVVALLTEDGSLAEPYEEGEICVHRASPTLMLGYWRGETQAPDLPLRDDTWFATGDLAYRDDAGDVHYVGRRDDLINTRGYRVSPGEIEGELLQHPAVAEVAVVGVPDPAWGQAIHAFVRPADHHGGTRALADELRQFVRTRLAAHEAPKAVHFVDALPTTTSGKLRRHALREQYLADG